MISIQCRCGATINLAEGAANQSVACENCGAKLVAASAEKLPEGAGGGDFDSFLLIKAGPTRVGDVIFLGGCLGIDIGKRPENHLVLPGKLVSRSHCKLERVDFAPSRWNLLDSKSTNGLFVNGQRVDTVELHDGDKIRIGEYDLEYSLVGEPVLAAVPEVAAEAEAHASSVAKAAPARPRGGAICPSCGTPRGKDVKICTDCGIHIDSGRPILISQARDEDSIYTNSENVIRLVSWVMPATPLPIPLSSEAYGGAKPLTIWTIAASTVLTSLAFLMACWNDQSGGQAASLMLWPKNVDVSKLVDEAVEEEMQAEEELRTLGPRARPKPTPAELEAERASLRREYTVSIESRTRSFHGYQLVTHAFLHDTGSILGFIFHLGGNMLFLLVFGSRINALIGNIATIFVYPALAIAAGTAHLMFRSLPLPVPMLGASGAINGLAGMYLILFPVHRVYCAMWFRWGLAVGFRLSLKIFAIRGFWVLLIYLSYDVLMIWIQRRLGAEGGTAHWAHVGGFVAGVAIALGILMSRRINCHNGDLLSVTFGRYAWPLIGKPSQWTMAGQPVAA